VVSGEAFLKRQAFLSLNTNPDFKNATGNKSLRVFKGVDWEDLHITTTLSVRSGDIVLIRAAGVFDCPDKITNA
jgi:hypothetical protein